MTTKLLLTLSLAVASFGAFAAMETQKEKYSYALGMNIANILEQKGLKNVELPLFLQAMEDVLIGKGGQLSDDEFDYVMKAQEALEAEEKKRKKGINVAEGEAFLKENQAKPGVQTLESGLQYLVEKDGDGDSPVAGKRVKVHYHGTLPDGTVFDSSVERGKPATFSVTGVIKGFSEALMLMKPGAKWRVFIPSELGYGTRGAGAKIGPNQVLIFDLELIEVL